MSDMSLSRRHGGFDYTAPTTMRGVLAERHERGATERSTARTTGAVVRQMRQNEGATALKRQEEAHRHAEAVQAIGHIGDEVAFAASIAAEVPAAAPYLQRVLNAYAAVRTDVALND